MTINITSLKKLLKYVEKIKHQHFISKSLISRLGKLVDCKRAKTFTLNITHVIYLFYLKFWTIGILVNIQQIQE